MSQELIPCPFISDGRAHGPRTKKNGFENWNVECLCGALGPDAANPEEADRLWNARTPSPEVTGSDYDKAVEALAAAGFFPEWVKWVALAPDSRAGMCLYYFADKPTLLAKNPFGERFWWGTVAQFGAFNGLFHYAKHPAWRESLRALEKGRVAG